jgi:hypothetical protein
MMMERQTDDGVGVMGAREIYGFGQDSMRGAAVHV